MKKAYDIILLEDNKIDAELIEIQLKKLDIAFELTVIDTEDELVEALAEECPDLVISDYNLTRYTGSDALALVQEQFPKLPFILVSG